MILLAVAGLLTGAVIGGGLGFALGYPKMPGVSLVLLRASQGRQ
jgi:hypothetical protein